MTAVDQAYNQALDRMTAAARYERLCQLYQSVRDMLAHRERCVNPHLDDRAIAVRVACRMYASDARAMALLERVS